MAIEIGGTHFEVEPLEDSPFGEIWRGGYLDVGEWLNSDLAKVVQEVRRAKLAVLPNTRLGEVWNAFGTGTKTALVPHIDKHQDNCEVQALYCAGDRGPTAFARPQALRLSVLKNIDELRDLINSTAPEIVNRYSLDLLLSFYESDEPGYMSFDVMESMGARARLDIEFKEIYDKYINLFKRYAEESKRYIHEWRQLPRSTVLSVHKLADLENTLWHWREGDYDSSRSEEPIHRNYIDKRHGAYRKMFPSSWHAFTPR